MSLVIGIESGDFFFFWHLQQQYHLLLSPIWPLAHPCPKVISHKQRGGGERIVTSAKGTVQNGSFCEAPQASSREITLFLAFPWRHLCFLDCFYVPIFPQIHALVFLSTSSCMCYSLSPQTYRHGNCSFWLFIFDLTPADVSNGACDASNRLVFELIVSHHMWSLLRLKVFVCYIMSCATVEWLVLGWIYVLATNSPWISLTKSYMALISWKLVFRTVWQTCPSLILL